LLGRSLNDNMSVSKFLVTSIWCYSLPFVWGEGGFPHFQWVLFHSNTRTLLLDLLAFLFFKPFFCPQFHNVVMLMWQPVADLGPAGGAHPEFCSRSPSFMATHDFLARITQIFDFFAFFNFRKVGKFTASIERLKTKSASASDHWTPVGTQPSDPHYRLALPRSPWGRAPPLQMLQARIATGDNCL